MHGGGSRSATGTIHEQYADGSRAVWERDQGQCTFVGESGKRCPARKFLEFDHIEPAARGGQATVENLRLRCRGHNAYAAERAFGAGFMTEKREAARSAAARARTHAREAEAKARAQAAAKAEAETRTRAQAAAAEAEAQARDVMACLRELRFRAGEARRAAEFCATIPDATLEERVRAALKFLCPKSRIHSRDGTSLAARI